MRLLEYKSLSATKGGAKRVDAISYSAKTRSLFHFLRKADQSRANPLSYILHNYREYTEDQEYICVRATFDFPRDYNRARNFNCTHESFEKFIPDYV